MPDAVTFALLIEPEPIMNTCQVFLTPSHLGITMEYASGGEWVTGMNLRRSGRGSRLAPLTSRAASAARCRIHLL